MSVVVGVRHGRERERETESGVARAHTREEGKTEGCSQSAALLYSARGAIPSSLSCDAQLLAAYCTCSRSSLISYNDNNCRIMHLTLCTEIYGNIQK